MAREGRGNVRNRLAVGRVESFALDHQRLSVDISITGSSVLQQSDLLAVYMLDRGSRR